MLPFRASHLARGLWFVVAFTFFFSFSGTKWSTLGMTNEHRECREPLHFCSSSSGANANTPIPVYMHADVDHASKKKNSFVSVTSSALFPKRQTRGIVILCFTCCLPDTRKARACYPYCLVYERLQAGCTEYARPSNIGWTDPGSDRRILVRSFAIDFAQYGGKWRFVKPGEIWSWSCMNRIFKWETEMITRTWFVLESRKELFWTSVCSLHTLTIYSSIPSNIRILLTAL